MHSVWGMGYARSGREKRDLSKHETLYVDPDYDRLRTAAGFDAYEERLTRGVLAGGSTLETLGGLVGLVVAIAGFSTLPFQMAGIAIIAIGIALFAQGLAVMSRWRDAVKRFEARSAPRGVRGPTPELRGGISTEVFGGLAGVVIGILALSGVAPLVLLPAGVTLFGAVLLLGGAAQPDLVFLAPEKNAKYARVTYTAIQTSGSIMALVGVASAVLGILGLLRVGPILTLTLIALLAIGSALLFAGGALTARLARRIVHP